MDFEFFGGRRGGRQPSAFFEGRHWGRHGQRRFKRGVLKWVILKLLEQEELHGYGFLQALREHGWAAGPGALYPVLAKLEESGLVTGREENGKRIYTLTDAGREYLKQQWPHADFAKFWSEPDEDAADEDAANEDGAHPELRDAVRKFMTAVVQGARTAKPETISQIAERVTAVRKEIYTLLANE